MADFLELEESELFDVQEDHDAGFPVKAAPASPSAAAAVDADAADASSDDDESSGLALDFDELTGAAERGVPTPQAAENAPAAANPAGSLGGASEVGSLKRFDSLGAASRGFGSEGDLALGASAPVRAAAAAALAMPTRASTGVLAFEGAGAGYLGTSMPIRIPNMIRRTLSGASPGSTDRPATFVPPHLLESAAEAAAARGAGSLALSPSAAAKREKLMARNAILRSTGFIEIQRPRGFVAPVGEVFDAVKDAAVRDAAAAAAGTPPGAVGLPKRPRPTSTLSAALGSSLDRAQAL